tara:strand:+ start:8955 stop:10700 length:1746 start_codon:yes stop_codon:yes gene_type:complete
LISEATLSKQNIIAVGRRPFKIAFRGGRQNFGITEEGYTVNVTFPYHLIYTTPSRNFQLESGAEVYTGESGFLIAREQEGSDLLLGLAFYSIGSGVMYDEGATDEYKAEVVNAYNDYLQDAGTATTEDVGERQQSLNERGETIAEERERLAREAEEAEAEEARQNEPIDEEITIFDNIYTFSLEGASIVMTLPMRIIQVTKGTVGEPIVTYRVERYSNSEGFLLSGQASWSDEAETQEAAEIILQNYVDVERQDFNIRATEDKANIEANKPILDKYENINLYWQEGTRTFQDALTGEFDIETSPFWKREIGRGNFGDAAVFTNGGETLELDDFDTPRVTTEGIQENKSGAVAFTIRQGWRVTFELTTDSSLSFIERGVVDGVEKSSNTFTFTMYAGDRLELDIDNERSGIRPFLVMIQGREWFSSEEADDEISLTMIKSEVLMVDFVQGTRYINKAGDVLDQFPQEITSEYQGRAYSSDAGTVSTFWQEALRENPEYYEARFSDRTILSQNPEAESSFIGQDEVGGQVVDAAEGVVEGAADVAGTFFDRFKWWILGGVVVIGILIYINARGRSGASPVGGE